jgi:hypothetical protein
MSRLFRVLLNALTVVSLLLFAATVIMWARSYDFIDEFFCWDSSGFTELSSYRDGFAVHQVHHANLLPYERFTWRSRKMGGYKVGWGTLFSTYALKWQFAGFAWFRDGTFWILVFPAWCPTAIFSVLPARAVVRCYKRRRAQAASAGFCSTCGYDLRATPDRCPECGTVPSNANAVERRRAP